MKWTTEEINKCVSLIKEFNDVKEVAKILNRTVKSIYLKLGKVGIRVVDIYLPLEDKNCLNCNKILKRMSDFKVRKFCNHSCAATYSNTGIIKSLDTKLKISKSCTGKRHSEETKIKLRGENNVRWKGGNKNKVLGKGKCGGCGLYNVGIKYKSICEDCRLKYYKFYRPSCEFIFDISNYKDYFDLELVKKHGWYSPKNKGNNLNGVSKDHLYSVKDGFKNYISPLIIKHPANCELIIHKNNQIKNSKSKISIEELIKRIECFDNKYVPLTQLVECHPHKMEVAGSSPVGNT